MKFNHFLLMFRLLLSMPHCVLACTVPPAESRELPVEVVTRADSAGVVIFDRFERSSNEIRFHGSVRRLFWGNASSLEAISFKLPSDQVYEGLIRPHEEHGSPNFWLGKRANLGYGPDCELVPNLSLGKAYIFIRVKPLSRYSLEPMLGSDDPWYELVLRVSEKKRKPTEKKLKGSGSTPD